VSKGLIVLLTALLVLLTAGHGVAATSTSTASTAILSGPLAKIDIKDAEIEVVRGTPKGRLIIAQHYALDPGWLDPREHQASATQVVYDYLVHDAMVKPMPQGLHTYSLAQHAEMAADYTKAAFRLRPGLKFHDGHPLTTKDVKWTYENYKGVNFKIFQDKLDRIELVDDRTIIFHFTIPSPIRRG
jgi:peptide/nickel transport system substrate-binding protein